MSEQKNATSGELVARKNGNGELLSRFHSTTKNGAMVNEFPDGDTFAVEDARLPNRFWIDNAVLTEYGAIIGPYGIAVYAALCKFANNATVERSSWPSYQTIAKLTGMSRREAMRAIDALVDAGLVEKIDGRSDPSREPLKHNGYMSNTFRILPLVTHSHHPSDCVSPEQETGNKKQGTITNDEMTYDDPSSTHEIAFRNSNAENSEPLASSSSSSFRSEVVENNSDKTNSEQHHNLDAQTFENACETWRLAWSEEPDASTKRTILALLKEVSEQPELSGRGAVAVFNGIRVPARFARKYTL